MALKKLILLWVTSLSLIVACQLLVIEDTGTVIEDMPTKAGFIVHSSIADASNLNPILAQDAASFDVMTKLYLGLITGDPFSGETIGEIAESWDISEDGLEYTS